MFIILIAIGTIFGLHMVDQFFQMSYLVKCVIKIILFATSTLIYIKISDYNYLKESLRNYLKGKKIDISFVLGVLIMISIVGVYFVLKNFVNEEQILNDIIIKYKVSKSQVIGYGLYISIVNAFLEELFFRGFIFLNLKQLGYKKTAYIFSSLGFSVYHLASILHWFSIPVLMFLLTGLFVGGLIFAYLDDEKESFMNSYIIHMFADFGVITVALILFNIV